MEAAHQELVHRARKAAESILAGDDDRLLCVVGPCSIHDVDAAREYGEFLRKEAVRHSGELLIVMRTYFEKPRTVGGWKGLINDPNLDGTYRINDGLRLSRGLLRDLSSAGIPVACEFLDNIIPQYIADFVSWVAIGARTSESQIHREFASGCSMPVGFKNGTSGRVETAVDAVRAAALSHWFPSVTAQGVSAILETTGNPACHVILRGGHETGPNHTAEFIARTTAMLEEHGLPARVMIDCSHGNSLKKPERQPEVAAEVARQVAAGSTAIMGVMVESNLVAGRQDLRDPADLVRGQSITDGCIGLPETSELLAVLADSVRSRRVAAVS